MYPSAFRVAGPPGPDGGVGWGQTCTKTFLGQMGMWVQSFIQIGAGVWIFINPPYANRQRNTYTPIFIRIDER